LTDAEGLIIRHVEELSLMVKVAKGIVFGNALVAEMEMEN
jgi:tryptophan synthase alpha subunit